ncbi:proteinase inhibitor I4 serpin [[Phormidium ambiguum] IAM M-71]|uniref:Proteinase inhibitor I4 serpin n=1 Tax=[Phormidium ambiguum] IAM M-71 TaxID=454136 RepID=A0A1U7ILQ3_9CYAN|nr:serpin family protein [Phormidium ambiguum]OKH38146.1 proteinase inhibitor I4 serpin [Phormidium ambiguum IAM M-71]
MKKQLLSRMSLAFSLIAVILLTGSLVRQPKEVKANVSNITFNKQNLNNMNEKLVQANTNFGFKLFSQIFAKDSNKNIFVSPSSVAIALQMTYNGAAGDTQQAMAQTLQLQGMSLAEINQSQLALTQSLTKIDPKVQLDIANSLWLKQEFPFKPEFLQTTEKYYQAKITNLDFNNPNSVNIINDWVSQNTNSKIPTIIDSIEPSAVLFLINAIYFKGNWQKEFSKSDTKEQPFTLLNGTRKQHPLMSQKGKYRYYETNEFQAIALPYGSGRLSMYVFLPKNNIKLTDFYNKLSAQTWQQWMKQFSLKDGEIILPKFKLEYNLTLNEALKALGMEVAFQDRANFSNMTAKEVQIDEVKHKTFVEVNEEGTEAAAVTSIGIRVASAPIREEPPFKMLVDRPFFCAIHDNQTGTILFMGSIVDPK